MTDYEYIITQCQRFSNSLWDEDILKECIDKLKTMSDTELSNLFCANELHADRNCEALSDYSFEDIIERSNRQIELESAIVQAIPTIKLVEIINSYYDDYKRKNDGLSSMDYKTFSQVCKHTSKELRRRYLAGVDCQIIEQAFNRKNNTDKVWLEWQYRKRKLEEVRYQDPYLLKLKGKELFADEEFVDHGVHGYENVISIKGCRSFWDEEGKRMSAIDFILSTCGVVPQFIGHGDEVVFAVASDSYELESAFEYKPEYMNSPLRNKIDKIFYKEYDKNLVLGCILVEKFIHLVAPNINAIVRCYDKDYLLGHFVLECPDELFTPVNTIADLKDLMPKDRKNQNDFLDLVGNLLDPPWKNGLDRYSFMDIKEDTSELPEGLPF